MSSPDIFRPLLMIRMDTSTLRFIRTPRSFSVFSWRGYYFSFCTLPFGWKASAFLYHHVGLVVTSAARSLGVPLSQYIDDRHVGQLFLSGLVDYQPSRQLAQAAAFILLFLLTSAGYFVNLAKSSPDRPLLLSSWVFSPILWCKPFLSRPINRRNLERCAKSSWDPLLHPPRLGLCSSADCPVRGLAEHRNGPVLHAPF